jgi:SAM-dependent methyltransferase
MSPTLSAAAGELLRCPRCKGALRRESETLVCFDMACGAVFPVVDGVPILINEANSVFSLRDFVDQRSTYFNLRPSRASRLLERLTPRMSVNVKAAANYRRLAEMLAAGSASPRVLVLGGSVLGEGMGPLVDAPGIDLIESDVSWGPRTALICDAHDIPLADASLDGLVAQAVLEHVVDPHAAVREIHRVLKPGGLVYAETPFMQQMHGGRYDFERFTYWGHRRLFRDFSEVDSGVACGPAMALAWSYTYFLRSFARSRRMRHILSFVGSLTSFWLLPFDRLLVNRPNALATASGYYFLGRKSDRTLTDRELIATYMPTL